MRAQLLIVPILLTILGSCRFESGPGGDGLTGEYFLERVNGQRLPPWPYTLSVESSDGPLEIMSPGSIKLRPNGTFLQELTTVERPTSTTMRTVTRGGSGTYRRLDDGTIEFTGGLGGTFVGTLSPGTGRTARVLVLDRRANDGLTYTYIMLQDFGLFF
jgi:hypothetical protein